jgi:hypothetical protein
MKHIVFLIYDKQIESLVHSMQSFIKWPEYRVFCDGTETLTVYSQHHAKHKKVYILQGYQFMH